jgi:hypothetical protein
VRCLASKRRSVRVEAGNVLRYRGVQADHYIIRMFPPDPDDVSGTIKEILSANGYIQGTGTQGTGTVDFGVTSSIDDAYMSGLTFRYLDERKREH